MANDFQTPINSPQLKSGPYLAKIVSHLDPSYMGTLEVQLLREVGNDVDSEGQLHQVKYISPFYGVTNLDFNGTTDDYNNTQKSYGMWMIPPDVGTTVVVIFIEGDARKGYWIGCAFDDRMNFMMPGYAASKYVTNSTTGDRLPVAEYNKKAQKSVSDPTNYKKPVHPFSAILKKQGLIRDDIRGITTSSARREVPSAVFGISTPGPLDKQTNAQKGSSGKAEYKVTNAFVSRLGGSSFVMDDGDDKFLRKTKASDGPPVYAQVEQGEKDGDVTIPHNELIRIRTRTGHQILLHNSEDLIYIANASGTTWVELTSNGKIDIYAKDSISLHTENDLNITADRGINLSAQSDINISSKENVNITGKNTNIRADQNHYETAQQIHMNGSTQAVEAKIPSRIPQHEPWSGHENLDPTMFVPSKTLPKNRNATQQAQATIQAMAEQLAQLQIQLQALQESQTISQKAGKNATQTQNITAEITRVKANITSLKQQLGQQSVPTAFEQYTTFTETFDRITKG